MPPVRSFHPGLSTTTTTTTTGGTTTIRTVTQVNPNMHAVSPFFTHHHRLSESELLSLQRANLTGSIVNSSIGLAALGSFGLPYYGAYGNPYDSYYYGPSYGTYASSPRSYEPPADETAPKQNMPMDARNNPSIGDIQSGRALNDILADLRKFGPDLPAAGLPMDADQLAHINVSRGVGNLGMLKPGVKWNWPVALNNQEFQEQRDRLTSRIRNAVKQARENGRISAETINPIADDVAQLQRDFRRMAVPFDQYLEAKNFLQGLSDAVEGLRVPDVANYFNGKYALTAKSIPGLVKQMTDNGLQFAAAVPGDESAYSALYQSLSAYDRSLPERK